MHNPHWIMYNVEKIRLCIIMYFFSIIHKRTIIYNKDWISYNPVRIIENGDLNHIMYNRDFFYNIYNLILDYI
jgi:hypothetical protein